MMTKTKSPKITSENANVNEKNVVRSRQLVHSAASHRQYAEQGRRNRLLSQRSTLQVTKSLTKELILFHPSNYRKLQFPLAKKLYSQWIVRKNRAKELKMKEI